MVPAQSLQFSIDKLKRQYGDEAEFVSRDGVRFNAFDHKWVLSTDGTTDKYIDMAWLYDYPLPFEQCVDLRFTLARSAQKYRLNTLKGRRSMLLAVKLSGLDETSVKKSAAHEENLTYKKRLKAICQQLSEDYPDKYQYLGQIFAHVELGNAPRKVQCEEKGALSEYEYYDLAEKLNNQAKDIVKGKVTDFDVIKWHVCYRFQQLFCARHSQVSMLKVSDFSCTEESYLVAKELTFKLPLVKQKDDAQCRVFGIKKNYLTGTALQTFLVYLALYKSKLMASLGRLKFHISSADVTNIFSTLPVIPHQSLFITDFNDDFSNAKSLVRSFSTENHSFNTPAKSMKSALMVHISRLDVKSDRVSGPIDIGVNRLRHTTAVNMAIDNKSREDIALMLENTPKAAEIYVDMTDELRASIDSAFQVILWLPMPLPENSRHKFLLTN